MDVPGVMVAAMLAVAAAGAQAEPYRIATDAEGAWVLNEETGAVRLCRTATLRVPTVVDVLGGVGEARSDKTYPGEPNCVAVVRPGQDGAVPGGYDGLGAGAVAALGGGPLSVAVRPGMLGDGSSGYQIGSSVGMLGNGTFGYGYDAPDNQVIIVRPEWINVTQY